MKEFWKEYPWDIITFPPYWKKFPLDDFLITNLDDHQFDQWYWIHKTAIYPPPWGPHYFENEYSVEVIPICNKECKEEFDRKLFTPYLPAKEPSFLPMRRRLFKTDENSPLLPPFLKLKPWEESGWYEELPLPSHWDFPDVWLCRSLGTDVGIILITEDKEGKVHFDTISTQQYKEQLEAKGKNRSPPFVIRWVGKLGR